MRDLSFADKPWPCFHHGQRNFKRKVIDMQKLTPETTPRKTRSLFRERSVWRSSVQPI